MELSKRSLGRVPDSRKKILVSGNLENCYPRARKSAELVSVLSFLFEIIVGARAAREMSDFKEKNISREKYLRPRDVLAKRAPMLKR